MVKGTKKIKPVEMTEDELDSIEMMPEDKRIPVVGKLNQPQAIPDIATSKMFRRLRADQSNWIKMTDDECLTYQEKGVLIGFDPKSGKGLIKE
jgi:hypothetical protein